MITKTDFIAFLDAPRHLWAIKHNKLSEKELNAFIQHLFDQGYEVEEYAEKYISEVLIPSYAVNPGDVILQATLSNDHYQARTDVLVKNAKTNKWDIYEIKSTNEVKKQHKYDATFQYLVFKEKYEIGTVNILHLNKEYVRDGELNLDDLFQVSDVTSEVQGLAIEVLELRNLAYVTASTENPGTIDKCLKPKECPCIDICHPNLPEYSIYDVNRFSLSVAKMRKLIELGVESVYDIPKDFSLSEIQRFQVDVAQSGEIVIDKMKIKENLKSITYPLYYIDYESYNPAIPMYDGYKPFDQMPFQWSLHIQREQNGELEHYEFIETGQVDPVPNFLSELHKYIGPEGSLVVWNKTFEGTQNKRMGEIYPQYKEFCEAMNSRMYDLMDIFRNQWYADPKLKGSFSIKNALPLIVPGLSYIDMEIAEGATAMMSWYEMVYSNIDDKERIRANLLKYCFLDTLAMVRILDALLGLI